MANIVILCGGGIKTAVAAWGCAKDNDLTLVHLSFGQASSSAELRATEALAQSWPRAKMMPLVIPHVGSLQVGSAEGGRPSVGALGIVGTHQPDDSQPQPLAPAMLAGLTPMILSVGVQVALRVGASAVVTGISRTAHGAHLGLPPGDSSGDERREMLHAFNIAFEALFPPKARVNIDSPLLDLSYAEIVQLAARFELPLEACWTCCASGETVCGECEQCKARSRAFTKARIADPATTQVTAG